MYRGSYEYLLNAFLYKLNIVDAPQPGKDTFLQLARKVVENSLYVRAMKFGVFFVLGQLQLQFCNPTQRCSHLQKVAIHFA